MAISANALFHFTSFQNLKKILECKYFQAHYSKENITFRTDEITYYVPMICFCDIPLTQINDHIQEYDGYAIGLSKEWGIGHGLNPVFYLNQNGITVTLENLHAGLQKHTFASGAYEHAFALMKPYKGRNLRNPDANIKVFYNEREWRKVPYTTQFQDKFVQQIYWGEEPANEVKKYVEGHRFFKMEFGFSDIKYLITRSDADKSELIDFLRSNDAVELLITQKLKIITIDEIFTVF